MTIPDEIHQNIRQRAIDVIGLWTDLEGQLKYQREVPFVHVSNEMIEQWFDVTCNGYIQSMQEPVYSRQEIEGFLEFEAKMNWLCESSPDTLPSIEKFRETAPFLEVCALARELKKRLNLRSRENDRREISHIPLKP